MAHVCQEKNHPIDRKSDDFISSPSLGKPMIGQNHEESYNEYIDKLKYEDLIDIRNHLDCEKFPLKYKIVCKKIKAFESDKEFIKSEKLKEKEFSSKLTTFLKECLTS